MAVQPGRRYCAIPLKVFPIDKRISWPILLVLFRNADDQRLFSTEKLLDRRFGPALSQKIKLRLLVLKAAAHLAMIPMHQPFCMRKVARGEYALDLAPPNVLRFAAIPAGAVPLSSIKTVTILSVEHA
jgi:hypothetical protein